jgi:hypothetical protein
LKRKPNSSMFAIVSFTESYHKNVKFCTGYVGEPHSTLMNHLKERESRIFDRNLRCHIKTRTLLRTSFTTLGQFGNLGPFWVEATGGCTRLLRLAKT